MLKKKDGKDSDGASER